MNNTEKEMQEENINSCKKSTLFCFLTPEMHIFTHDFSIFSKQLGDATTEETLYQFFKKFVICFNWPTLHVE